MARSKKAQWSLQYQQCISCSSTDRPHWAKGQCVQCYHKKYNSEHKDSIKESFLRWKASNKEKYNSYQRSYSQRKKHSVKTV